MALKARTPGQLIDVLLGERGWDQRALAAVVGIDASNLNKIIAGKRRVDAEVAIALAEAFGVQPEQFLDLQQAYDLAKARTILQPDEGRANRAVLFGQLPIAEMINRGWLDVEGVQNVSRVEAELARFFGVKSSTEIEFLPHAAKKTDIAGPITPAQLAWIYRVKQIASEMVVGKYSRPAIQAAVKKLENLLKSAEEARKVPRILAECGIRFVIVESLKLAKIDGVCIWLDRNSPVIGMSFRFDRIDNFWFVLRHEIEHVLRGDGIDAIILDAELDGERAGTSPGLSQEERTANEAAANFCVSSHHMDQFIARKAPVVTKRDMLGFANTIHVHPGIVAGQIQRKLGRYDLFREQLVKVRSIVTPGAAVDGWGDVFPVLLEGSERL